MLCDIVASDKGRMVLFIIYELHKTALIKKLSCVRYKLNCLSGVLSITELLCSIIKTPTSKKQH